MWSHQRKGLVELEVQENKKEKIRLAKEIVTDLYRDMPEYPNKKLLLSLPLPISINHMYVNTKHGGHRLNERAEEYVRTSKGTNTSGSRRTKNGYNKKNTYGIMQTYSFYMPDRGLRDSHNMIKLLFDMMQDIAFHNDYYVMPRIQLVEYDKQNPRVEVYITTQKQRERNKWLKFLA